MNQKYPTVTVGEFYTRHSEGLQMKSIGSSAGFGRRIREPTINRPGLALSGFYTYFAEKRIQVLGSAERSYLKSLNPEGAAGGGRGGAHLRFPDADDNDEIHQCGDDRAGDGLRPDLF